MIRVLPILFLLLTACNSPTPSLPHSIAPSPSPIHPSSFRLHPSFRVGWAYEAYPETTFEKMRDDFARMRENGANAIWIGHNNPGEVDAQKVEPGMSYAVYAALQNENDPRYQDARAMFDAIKRALDAARETKLQVILPIGYQIQMGAAWNEKYPDDLRKNFDGTLLELYNSDYTASPYSEQYRADITQYYEWIQREWVEPYRDVIVMLSLADEPMGGDYSVHAKNEFARRYGVEMRALSQDGLWQIGEFQSRVVADYAAWSANEWKRINPNILTTMSFHGGETARRVWGLPDIEKLFSQTPENFIVTFDAYLHDDLATKPATADERAQLKLFLSTIGHYSRTYNKPIALWAGVNAWGLAQESSSPLGISDAMTNLLLLYDLPARVGGKVWGIFAWNYNVKEQGLENYARPTTYDPRAMEIAVHRSFPLLRTRHAEPQAPNIAILVSQRVMYEALANSRASDVPPEWFDTTLYARAFADRRAAIVTLGKSLDAARGARIYVVLDSDRNADVLNFLKARISEDAMVITDMLTARALNMPYEIWNEELMRIPARSGAVYVVAIENLSP